MTVQYNPVQQYPQPPAPKKNSSWLPMIIGGAGLLLCCCAVAVVVGLGGLVAVSRTGSATRQVSQVSVTGTPAGKLPTPIPLTRQGETQVPANGSAVKDSQNVAVTVPISSVVGADSVVMTTWLPSTDFDADLKAAALERKSLLYNLRVSGMGENMGGVYLSFPAANSSDRLAVLLNRRFMAVLGVVPQDGRLVVRAAVKPGDIADLDKLEPNGDMAYFVVAGPSAQSRQLAPTSLAAVFGLQPVSWATGGALGPAAQATSNCRIFTKTIYGVTAPVEISCWNDDRSVLVSASPPKVTESDGLSLIQAATKIKGLYQKLGLKSVPTTNDPLLLVIRDYGDSDPEYGPVTGYIYLTMKDVSEINDAEAQQLLAHEMFHWIEHKTFPMLRRGNSTWFTWQMETMAEAASFMIDPKYQTAELRKRGASFHSDAKQVLGWQESAGDWSTSLFGLKTAAESDRYIQGITVRMGICTGKSCVQSVQGFVDSVNTGLIFEDTPLFHSLYPLALPSTARYLLGFKPDADYSTPCNTGVDFSAPELQNGRGVGDYIHVSMARVAYVDLSSSSSVANLSRDKVTGIATINAVIEREALYPLRLSNGADYPLEGTGQGLSVQPNVPYSLRIEAGAPFYYRMGSGELVQRDGKEATVIEPITSAEVSVRDKSGALRKAPGIPLVRLVAINDTGASVTLRGTFSPMEPIVTVNPPRITIPNLTTPVKLDISLTRIFPGLKTFNIVIDYHDGANPVSLSASTQADGTAQVTDSHTYLKQNIQSVSICFKNADGSAMPNLPCQTVPVDGGSAGRPAFNRVGLQLVFGNTNYDPNYSYEMSITWKGLSFSSADAPFIRGTVSNDYKTITLSFQSPNGRNIQLTDIPLKDANELYKTYTYGLSGAAAILAHAQQDGATPNWKPETNYPTPPFVNIYLVQYPR